MLFFITYYYYVAMLKNPSRIEDENDFQNLISSSLSKDASLVKFS